MRYDHTQTAPLHLILYAALAIDLGFAWAFRTHPAIFGLLFGAVCLLLAALSFGHLTVRDEEDCLAIRYGPLPIFRKRIPYSEITSVEPGRSAVIDGWGIHWVPGRGTTYNLWGFGCVVLKVGKRVIRVGSDDVENLVEFLRGKLGESQQLP